MQVLVSLIISALMVLGSVSYVQEKNEALGASQKISDLTALSSPDDADTFAIVDNSGTPTTKKITWGNATSGLQTFYDGRYQTLLTNSAGLAAALSDETGTGLSVFGTTPTLTTPILNSATITTPYINVSGTEAAGDLLYLSDNGGTLSRLAVGSESQYLQVSSGLPSWGSAAGQLFTASTTVNATTTIAADSLTNRALVINGLAYQWPSSRGFAGSVLKEDGSGTLTWGRPLKLSYAGAGPSATAGSATTTLLRIPSGVMTASSTISFNWSGTSLYNGQGGSVFLSAVISGATSTMISFACSEGTNGETAQCTGGGLISFISQTSQSVATHGMQDTQQGIGTPYTSVTTSAIDFSNTVDLIVWVNAPNASNNMNVGSFSVVVTP